MSSSSYRTFESEDDSNSWLISSEYSIEDEDELTLLNGDEDTDEDSTTFEAFLKLSIRLKKEYNLREASVALERCDKIWDTMQLLKNVQPACDDSSNETNDENSEEEDEKDESESVLKAKPKWLSQDLSSEPIPYIKYQPTQGNGNNALPNFYLSVKSQKKIYNCATCGKIYNEKRAFRIHTKRDHGIALPSPSHRRKRMNSGESRLTRSKTPQNIESPTINAEKETARESLFVPQKNARERSFVCPICHLTYLHRSSLINHAKIAHKVILSSKGKQKKSSEEGKIAARSLRETNPDQEAKRPEKSRANYLYRYIRRKKGLNRYNYTYACIVCGEKFKEKYSLRGHAKKVHGIIIPLGDTTGGLCVDVKSRRKYASDSSESKGRNKTSKNDKNDEIPMKTRQRPGPKSSKNQSRPKRICAINTSYKECTKDDEDAAHCEIPSPETTEKSSNSQMTKCFLCRKAYIDIIRHFKDYHRISHPDSVLPLSEKIVEPEIVRNKEKKKIITPKDNESESESSSEKSSTKSNDDKSFAGDKLIEGLYKRIFDKGTGRDIVQCLMCKYKYANYGGVRRHLYNKMVNGVVKAHEAWPRGTRRGRRSYLTSNNDNSAEDSSSTTKMSTRSYDNDNDDSSRKRGTSSDDESSSTSEPPLKKRKIEIASTNDTSGGARRAITENNRRASVVRRKEKNLSYELRDDDEEEGEGEEGEEDKKMNQRDTRDSSDRDSGIGISITIKKRNNSYEVVEKDNCCGDDKAKDYCENVKDENVISSDPSSRLIGSDCPNKDELLPSHRRDILELDNQPEGKNVDTTDEDDEDDVAIIEYEDHVATDETSDDIVDRKLDPFHNQEIATIMTGSIKLSET